MTKSSPRTSRQHLPFRSLNSNTRIGSGRCSRFIKVTSKTKVNCCSTLDRFEQTFHHVWVFLWPFFKNQVNVHCGIGSISMPIASHIHNAANYVVAKNNCQSYSKKCEILFSRKEQGAIRTDWKIHPCIFHLCIDNNFSSGYLIFDIFNNRPSQIAYTVTTAHVTCTQTALHVHKNSCTFLIENTIEIYLSPAHIDHYALRK